MSDLTKTILQSFSEPEFNSSNEGAVYEIYSPTPSINGRQYTGFITDLRLKAEVNSLPETPLPDIGLKDSRPTVSAKMRDYEWTTERFEVEFCLSNDNAITWHSVFRASIKNKQPFHVVDALPFLTPNPAYCIADGMKLGIRFVNAGFGFMGANDTVLVHGVVREELRELENSVLNFVNQGSVSWLANTNQLVASNNANRRGMIIQNTSNDPIFLNFNAGSVIGVDGIRLISNASYEITNHNLWRGAIYCSSTTAGSVNIIEFE